MAMAAVVAMSEIGIATRNELQGVFERFESPPFKRGPIQTNIWVFDNVIFAYLYNSYELYTMSSTHGTYVMLWYDGTLSFIYKQH